MSVSRYPEPYGAIQVGSPHVGGQIPSVTAGTSVAGHATTIDAFGAYVQMLASAGFNLFLTGISVRAGHFDTSHAVVEIATGAAASEVVVGRTKAVFDLPAANDYLPAVYQPIFPWVPIATGARIAVQVALGKIASSVLVTLHYAPATSSMPA